MKKSTIYGLAQIAVIDSKILTSLDKIQILRVLMEEEDLAAFVEEQAEKENTDEVF